MHHVIIGAGPAGVTAAETIRKRDPAFRAKRPATLEKARPRVKRR